MYALEGIFFDRAKEEKARFSMIKNLDKLEKAQATFERFRVDMKTDRDQAGAVQAFEFCYELAWKVMKAALEDRGLQTESPKDTFRKAALENIVQDPEIWFFFQKIRNITVHTYEQANLDTVVASFDQFSQELKLAVQNLRNLDS